MEVKIALLYFRELLLQILAVFCVAWVAMAHSYNSIKQLSKKIKIKENPVRLPIETTLRTVIDVFDALLVRIP